MTKSIEGLRAPVSPHEHFVAVELALTFTFASRALLSIMTGHVLGSVPGFISAFVLSSAIYSAPLAAALAALARRSRAPAWRLALEALAASALARVAGSVLSVALWDDNGPRFFGSQAPTIASLGAAALDAVSTWRSWRDVAAFALGLWLAASRTGRWNEGLVLIGPHVTLGLVEWAIHVPEWLHPRNTGPYRMTIDPWIIWSSGLTYALQLVFGEVLLPLFVRGIAAASDRIGLRTREDS